MFCPNINDECAGEVCRDWDAEKQTCRALVESKGQFEALLAQFKAYFEAQQTDMEKYLELYREGSGFQRLWVQFAVKRMMADPTVPEDVKETIRKAFEAPSSEVATKLLREAGLIDE